MNKQSPLFRKIFLMVTLAIVVFACAPAASQKSTKQKQDNPYKEDLSSQRIKYKSTDTVAKVEQNNQPMEVPKYDITKRLDKKMDSLYSIQTDVYTKTHGYRILVYTGSSRADADVSYVKAAQIATTEEVYKKWESPIFRVKVGDFIDRVEAHYVLSLLKESFPNAMVIPDEVNIKKENK